MHPDRLHVRANRLAFQTVDVPIRLDRGVNRGQRNPLFDGGGFVHETAAIEQGIPLAAIDATVQADWDVNGLKGEPVSPHMQAIRVHLTLDGPDAAQAELLEAEFTSRCPIY